MPRGTNGISGTVADIIETHRGEWLTIPEIITWVQRRHPGTSRETVNRAVYRLREHGIVATRVILLRGGLCGQGRAGYRGGGDVRAEVTWTKEEMCDA